MSGDLAQLADTVADFDAQIQQKQIERDRANATMEAQQQLVAVLQERVDMRSTLTKMGAGAKSNVIDARKVSNTIKLNSRCKRASATSRRRPSTSSSASATRLFPTLSPTMRKSSTRRKGRPTNGAKNSSRPS